MLFYGLTANFAVEVGLANIRQIRKIATFVKVLLFANIGTINTSVLNAKKFAFTE